MSPLACTVAISHQLLAQLLRTQAFPRIEVSCGPAAQPIGRSVGAHYVTLVTGVGTDTEPRKLHSCWRRELRLGAVYLSHSISFFGVSIAVTCRRAPIGWVATGCRRRGIAGGVSGRLSRVRFGGKGCSRSPHSGRPLPVGCWQTRRVCPCPTVAVGGEVIS